MNRIRGVFFDLHGTLLLSHDVDAAWERWAMAFHSEMNDRGADVTLGEFKAQLDRLFNAPEPEYREPGMTLFMRRVKTLGDSLGVEIPREEVRLIADKIIRVWHRDMYLDPEARGVLETLRGRYKVGLITNWEHTPRITELLGELGIDALFDTVVVSDEVGVAKPDPGIFREALSRTGVSPGDAVYVGDMDVDVAGSRNAGVHPVLIKRRDQRNWASYSYDKPCGFDGEVHRISRLSELLGVLGVA
ncbi:HAD family hydrolase [Candidatus Bathyarchaeota archaeon]|nr:HAD family hydrolase [Candidatus Bathyarchaeota archaeon]